MTPPSVPFAIWIWAAFDPVLIVTACYLGWRADQPGKIFIAALAAFAITLLVNALVTFIGLPVLAPLSRSGPTLFPVRAVAAVVWATLAYAARRLLKR